MIFVAIMNICFAAALPLLKIALGYTDPMSMVAMRMLLGGGLLLAYAAIFERIPAWRTVPWRLIMVTALFEVYILCLGEAWALERMSAAQASIMWSLLPLITACIVRVFQSKSISLLQVSAIIIAMAGSYTLIDNPRFLISGWSVTGLPEGVMFLAVCSAAYGYILLEQLACEMQSVIVSSGLMMVVGGFGSLITGIMYQGVEPLSDAVCNQTLWIVMIGIVILENIIGLTLQTLLTRRFSATFLALSSFITPLSGVFMGVWFLGEPWYSRYGGALGCILCAILLFYQEEIRKLIVDGTQQIG